MNSFVNIKKGGLWLILLLAPSISFSQNQIDSLLHLLQPTNLSLLNHTLETLIKNEFLKSIKAENDDIEDFRYEVFEKVLKKTSSYPPRALSLVYAMIAYKYIDAKNSLEGYRMLRKALNVLPNNDFLSQFYCYQQSYLFFNAMERLDSAVLYSEKMLDASYKTQQDSLVLVSLYSTASLCYKINHYAKSIYYFQTLLYHPKAKYEDKRNSLNTIGLSYRNQKEYDSARYYFQKTLDIASAAKDTIYMALAHGNKASCYFFEKRYEEALEGMFKDLQFSILKKEKGSAVKCLNMITEIYLHLGNISQATLYYDSLSRNVGKIMHRAYHRMDYFEISAFYYKEKKDFEKSLYYLQNLLHLKDSMQNIENSKEAVKLAELFAFDRQASQIADLERHEVFNNQVLIGVFCILFLVLVVLFILYRNNRFKQKVNEEITLKNEEIILKNAELASQKEEITIQAEDLNRKNQQLLELDKFKEVMLGTIVHDLKNPLNALLHLVPVEENLPSQHPFKKVQHLSQTMLNLVMNILDVQKFEDAQMNFDTQEIYFSELMEQARQQTTFLLEEKNIRLQALIHQDITVKVEKNLIARVLVNLITNAIKYSPQNSQITVKTKQENSFLKISIVDYGRGIPSDKLDKVFDKFVQIEAQHSGQIRSTGLGLTFCKMAVEAHKGKIGVNSIYQQSTEFWFTLPVKRSEGTVEKQIISEVEVSSAILTEEDKILLNHYIKEFQSLEVYYSTELDNLLEKINFEQTENLKLWGEKMKKAVFTMNEKLYKKLVGELT